MEEINTAQMLDFGAILYEKSNAKSALDAPKGKITAKGWAQRIYMLLLGVALIVWFLYSVITQANQANVSIRNAIGRHLATLFVLMIAEAILLLTAFGGWGKFARITLRYKVLTRQHRMEGVRTRQLEEELKTADANKAKENAIRIYRNHVVVVNNGEETVIDRSHLQQVKCEPKPTGYQITFSLYDNTQVVANILLPLTDLPLVKKYFDNFDYIPAPRGKGYFKKKFPLLAFTFIPLLIGIALIIVHSLVLPKMPIIFGIVFLAFGVLFVTIQFNDVAVIKHGMVPICSGLILTALPIGIALTIADLVEEITLVSLLLQFSPVHAVLSLFFGFGPLLIILGVSGIIDCAKL